MDDKAQGPEGRLMLMVGRFKRKGKKDIFLTRRQDPDLYPVYIRDRLVLILIGLHM